MPFRVMVRFGMVCAALIAAAAQVPPPLDATFLKKNFRVLEVNVTASDSRGNPVEDLSKDDLIFKENGSELQIVSFSRERAEFRPQNAIAPLTFTNHVEQGASAATVILLDALNTSTADLIGAKAELLKSLGEA